VVALAVASISLGAACSDSGSTPDLTAPTTTATAPVAPTSSTTTSTLTAAPSSTAVSTANGVVTVKGYGNLTVPLPASVPRPAIVHAHYVGNGAFAVTGIDARARRTGVLASSLGDYDGTFAVGFVEAVDDPTTSLRIVTSGPWQIDIGSAVLAPPLGRGREGVGDAVISYLGSGADAHLTYRGRSRLIVNVYESGGLVPLVNTMGPYDGPISLLAGPAFIAVTTSGKWSMIIE
jgi:hypothetical protein